MKTRIKVDCNKIIKVSEITEKKLRVMSEEMGHTSSFLSNMIRDSDDGIASMAMSDYILFKSLYLEDISYKENDSVKMDGENAGDKTVEKNELYKLIYSAVYQAVKQAWEDVPEPEYEFEQIVK